MSTHETCPSACVERNHPGREHDPARDGCYCWEVCEMGPTCPGAIAQGMPDSGCHRVAKDAATDLIATGIFQSPAQVVSGLAEDEAVIDSVTRQINEGGWPGGTPRDLAVTLIRVVAAALAEREGERVTVARTYVTPPADGGTDA